jgi:hypothetical protein
MDALHAVGRMGYVRAGSVASSNKELRESCSEHILCALRHWPSDALDATEFGAAIKKLLEDASAAARASARAAFRFGRMRCSVGRQWFVLI